MPLPEKVAESDLIARVTIASTQNLEGVKGGRDYRSLAKVKVTGAIKGSSVGQVVDLEYDNGLACPNVRYSEKDDCLIFAVKMDNGRYHTFNAYFGKIEIISETDDEVVSPRVSGWALGLEGNLTLERAIQEIKKYIER